MKQNHNSANMNSNVNKSFEHSNKKNHINTNVSSHIVSSTSRITSTKSTKSLKTQKYSCRNNKSNCDCLSRISQYTVLSNTNNLYAKRCHDKYCYAKDKLKFELDKKQKKCISLYQKTNCNTSNCNRLLLNDCSNLDHLKSFGNSDNKTSNKTIKTFQQAPYDINEDDTINHIFNNYNAKVNSDTSNARDKAVQCIIKSNMFALKEKMLFWFTNANIKSHTTKRQVIEDYKEYIQMKKRYFESMIVFKPTSTAQNCLTFIRSIDEDDLKQLAIKGDEKELNLLSGILTLLYALLGIANTKMPIAKMILNLYTNIFNQYNVISISKHEH